VAHVEVTKGKIFGHIIRRLIHIFCIVSITFLYYHFLPYFTEYKYYVLLLSLLTLSLFECIRIKCRWVLLGMREFEAKTVCSAAWSIFGLIFIFLFAPAASYTYPVAVLAAVIDPLSGELKGRMPVSVLICLLFVVAMLLWFFVAHRLFAWPMLYGVLVVSVTILMDFIKWQKLDDNFTMLVAPFITLSLLAFLCN
jgi:hypothetical protein